jgi:hypothetical protein
MIKLTDIIKEAPYVNTAEKEKEIGIGKTDPESGVKSTLTNIDPETGKFSWDVEYPIDPEFIYKKLEDLVQYMDKAEKGTELGQIKDILKNLKNKTSRMAKK